MGKETAHPKEHGIVPNKEGFGAVMVEYKVDNTHFIIVLDETGKKMVEEIQQHPEKLDQQQLDTVMAGLAVEDIYAETVGEKASRQQLEAAFDTTDMKSIVKEVIMNGKFH